MLSFLESWLPRGLILPWNCFEHSFHHSISFLIAHSSKSVSAWFYALACKQRMVKGSNFGVSFTGGGGQGLISTKFLGIHPFTKGLGIMFSTFVHTNCKKSLVYLMLNKNTRGVKKCGVNQKQHCKQAGATKRFDIS